MANTSWAYSLLVLRDAPLFDSISAQARPTIRAFDPQALANTSLSFAAINSSHHAPLLDALAAEAIPKINALPAQSLQQLLDAHSARISWRIQLYANLSVNLNDFQFK